LTSEVRDSTRFPPVCQGHKKVRCFPDILRSTPAALMLFAIRFLRLSRINCYRSVFDRPASRSFILALSLQPVKGFSGLFSDVFFCFVCFSVHRIWVPALPLVGVASLFRLLVIFRFRRDRLLPRSSNGLDYTPARILVKGFHNQFSTNFEIRQTITAISRFHRYLMRLPGLCRLAKSPG